MDFERVELERWASLTRESASEVGEQRFWSRLSGRVRQSLPAAASHVAWAPGSSRALDGSPVLRLACCVSLNVRLFGSSTRTPETVKSRKTLARTADVCYGVSWRRDGRLVAAGDARGCTYVLDATTGSVLRAMTVRRFGDERRAPPVRATAWSTQGLLSGSDGGVAVLWDVGAGKRVSTFSSKEGEVRAVASLERSRGCWLVGSYDGTVSLLDERASLRPQLEFLHDDRVEALSVDGDAFASAGGTRALAWDLVKGGGAPLRRFDDAHAKTVTSVSLAGHRVLTASLDGAVKAHSLSDDASVRVLGGRSGVLATALFPAGEDEDRRLAVARADGSLEIRCAPPRAHPQRKKPLEPPTGTYRHFTRGRGFRPALDQDTLDQDKVVVVVGAKKSNPGIDDTALSRRKKPKKLAAYEEALRKFRYGDALDEALATRDPVVVVSVLRDLERRGAARTALDGRDEDRLEPLLAFLAAHLPNPRYAHVLLDVAHAALDLYAHAFGRLPDVDDLAVKLRLQLRTELQNQLHLLRLQGHLAGLRAVVTPSSKKPSSEESSSSPPLDAVLTQPPTSRSLSSSSPREGGVVDDSAEQR